MAANRAGILTVMRLSRHQDDPRYRHATSLQLSAVIGLAILVLVVRLFIVQIQQHDLHTRLSDQNRVRLKILEASRGQIFDRENRVLARNRPSYQICIMPSELRNERKILERLLGVVDSSGKPVFDSLVVDRTMERGKWRQFEALPILEDASIEVVSVVEEHQLELPGVLTVVEARREYPYGDVAGHAIGYTAEISEKEMDAYKEKGYRLGNRVGAKGLEKRYETVLRGVEGKKFLEVNVYGKELEILDQMGNFPAIPGNDIVTTIDVDLQLTAEEAVPDTVKGAVVALDPRNGEILVMLSSPRIDGNIFSLSRDRRTVEWARLALDSNRPLNNRAVIGLYEPASTFKPVVSLAGFRTELISETFRGFQPCNGGYRFGRRYQRCWKASGHGRLDFFGALKQSCDTYYYQAGLLLGMKPINESAAMLGFGNLTGVDLPAERSGVLMDSVVYNRKFKSRGWKWTRGQILNLAIGQGQLVTPLQLANYAAGLANGKFIYRPHFLKEIRSPAGDVLHREESEIISVPDITGEQHQILLEALRQVVNEAGGTGGRARVEGVVVGGKTGSAENPQGENTHALFIGFAPLGKPEIAVAVILENVGHGGSHAAPVAQKVLQGYFHGADDEKPSS